MNQRFAGVRNMPTNNNQKGPSAVARLAQLPVVHSACSKLLVLYADTKCNHPSLKSVCEVLENKVTALGSAACHRVSPVMVKLEPQISIANDVACRSLDWLETTFPVLHAPPEQVVVTAKNKMHELQDAVGIAANGTVGCVQHSVAWVMERVQQVDDGTERSLVKRAISVASVGLDSALNMSEALVDQVLPPTEEDKEAAAHVVGFEVATVRSCPVRLVSLAAKLCRRSYHMVWAKMQSVQVCCFGDFVPVIISGSRPADYLFDLGLEHPGFASVSATSGCVCVFLYLPDVHLELPTV
ncbi:perilipin-2-like isoform X2 [Anabas testudineus]|uniref:perilipin-2-like isoform X2 n=1 Tax=Anabas testudineus TaxID=64144 RepID=UPI000E464CD6|nr:perilipin-2-like isoform X2 [Anabas testudineus]